MSVFTKARDERYGKLTKTQFRQAIKRGRSLAAPDQISQSRAFYIGSGSSPYYG